MRLLGIFLCSAIFAGSLHANEDTNYHSHASQDEFVFTLLYDLLGKKDPGYYLEIGAGEPIYINNTYVFEKNYGWQGLSIDISADLMPRWYAARSNSLLSSDATQLDYSSLLKEFPEVIDYLSLDVDGHYDTVLRKVMHSNHLFKVITIEHDLYRFGDVYRNKERAILSALGYYLLCPDVSHVGLAFEDWWVHPDFFSAELLQQLMALDLQGKDCREIVQKIKMLTSN